MRNSNMPAPTGPFDSLRDYVNALESHGRVLRVPEIDQDAYEATAFMYRLIDQYGWYDAPCVIFERAKIGGRWLDGPVVTNQYGGWDCEAIALGVKRITRDQRGMYAAARERILGMRNADAWVPIAPEEIVATDAPCKEVRVAKDAIDLTGFAFMQTNPGDAGRYINTGCVVLEDPKVGRNVGIYRCEIKGPRTIAVSTGAGQDGWNALMGARDAGASHAPVAIVVGADPIVYAMAGSKIASPDQDELALAGAFSGRPVEVVKCDTNELQVPAHAEMIIEGEIRFEFVDEGPFGERYGYLGPTRAEGLLMHVTGITHRHSPWLCNQFTGVTRGVLTALSEVNSNLGMHAWVPGLAGMHFPDAFPGYCFVAIEKTEAGQGLSVGQPIAQYRYLYTPHQGSVYRIM